MNHRAAAPATPRTPAANMALETFAVDVASLHSFTPFCVWHKVSGQAIFASLLLESARTPSTVPRPSPTTPTPPARDALSRARIAVRKGKPCACRGSSRPARREATDAWRTERRWPAARTRAARARPGRRLARAIRTRFVVRLAAPAQAERLWRLARKMRRIASIGRRPRRAPAAAAVGEAAARPDFSNPAILIVGLSSAVVRATIPHQT